MLPRFSVLYPGTSLWSAVNLQTIENSDKRLFFDLGTPEYTTTGINFFFFFFF